VGRLRQQFRNGPTNEGGIVTDKIQVIWIVLMTPFVGVIWTGIVLCAWFLLGVLLWVTIGFDLATHPIFPGM
jgi:hypothetical protein